MALLLFSGYHVNAQKEAEVDWLSFEQLDDSLNRHPKKVFIDFYTSWCTYCRRMDKLVFTKPEIIKLLNQDYYAVRMNAESTDTIQFEGQSFLNLQAGKKRGAIHQLAELLAQRDGKFTPPTMVILDPEFKVQQRYFEYLDSGKLLRALQD